MIVLLATYSRLSDSFGRHATEPAIERPLDLKPSAAVADPKLIGADHRRVSTAVFCADDQLLSSALMIVLFATYSCSSALMTVLSLHCRYLDS